MQRVPTPTPGVPTQQPQQPFSEMEQQLNNTQQQQPQQQPRPSSSSSSRAHHFHPARPAIIDLFNLYLGVRNARQKSDESVREPPHGIFAIQLVFALIQLCVIELKFKVNNKNKTQKRVTAINRDLPPPNEQFLYDFEQIQSQFPDQEQLRGVTESVVISLVIQCCGHAPRAEFLLFALRSLCNIGCINWDAFLPCLLSSVSSAESPGGVGQTASAAVTAVTSVTSSQSLPTSNAFPNFQSSSSPASPLPSMHGVGSPAQSVAEPSSLSPMKSNDAAVGQQSARSILFARENATSSLRQLSCKIILIGLESNLMPVTRADIFSHMLGWLVNWDQKQQGVDEFDSAKFWRPDKALIEWIHTCLDVIWLLVEDDKCRVPFYELVRSGLQFIENIPDDEALFTLILEIHRRRDMMATHMQMLDQHLHCPTFGTPRLLPQATANISGETVTNMRYSPITYPSVLGEPLHGEELASSIQRGSLDWERALRCLRHAFRNTPSPDWWRRVLLLAPCHRLHAQGPTPGAVFTSEMISEATIDRIVELLKLTNSGMMIHIFKILSRLCETNCWQEWLIFSDVFFFLMKHGCIDFVDFIDKLVSRLQGGDQHILRTNHVTWLLAQIIRVELVMNALNTDPRKVETTRKILSFHKEDRSSDPNNPQSILLDFISSCQNLRIWSLNTSTREYLNNEQLQKGKQIDEWWRQVSKGERIMDYMNMDERSIGMFWVVSYTMAQPACETVMNWLTSAGITEILPGQNLQSNERFMVMQEVSPLPISLLSGFSTNLCLKLAHQMEESMFSGQVVPSIAMVETYVRVLLIAPHALFRSLMTLLTQRNQSPLNKPAASILVFEILNYRLLSLYRYQGKNKGLIHDITKIIATLKGKRGDHRAFRLAENLCMNLILSMREFFYVKRDGKGPTEFTETLNRITVTNLAIIIKTRGVAEVEHLLYLQTMLEQILATSQHAWSEKTLRYFPNILREALSGRIDKKGLAIQAWQQAEATVIAQCSNLLSATAEPSYVKTYMIHSFPVHRQYLCAAAWKLMYDHPESINSEQLRHVLREFSPEEVTSNIYTMVDVVLHHFNLEVQHGRLQDIMLKVCTNFGFFIWTIELVPLDILLLALIDRDDDPNALRIVINILDSKELQQRVKMYLMNRGPPEHWLFAGSFKRAELQMALGNHLSWKESYPTFFDDIAARLLPVIPLIVYRLIENDAIDAADRVLQVYSTFLHYYPLNFTFVRDILAYFYGHLPGKLIFPILHVLDLKKIPFSESFPQHINLNNGPPMCPPLDYFATLLLGLVNHDPGTYTQLILETAVIEILSLPVTASQIVSSLVQIVVHIQPTLVVQSSSSCNTQLPPEFHIQLYIEAARVIKESWWLTDGKRSVSELESAVCYALLDPSWAAQDNTSTAIGNVVALLHSFYSNLPLEWLEGTHLIIKNLRPVTSIAGLRIAFRIMGPLLPRLANAHTLFNKMLSLLLNVMADVFGRNVQPPAPIEASEISDIIDFLHHIVHYEGQGGPVQASSKPRVEVLLLIGRAAESLRPDVQHLLTHLRADVNSSVYAATHPKFQTTTTTTTTTTN
ncbi:mediator of RNA polymerase ii transcription subunit 23 [Phtheirospermum japonicum]|uniref:Mediator of RNA polymerase ii transcription subunit 23 n=1 Tax=Phtheirospermum japonicum TaxID=374723 RepID=A0A830CIG9_9LAMI|nr:mediator of RNA polymerase ii transcription subunit 23 [Phtheirospermum japonicum]